MNLLSSLALVALALYLDSGIRVIALDRRSDLNRIVFVLDMVLALWAVSSVLSYSAKTPETAWLIYRAFSPTWNVFFGLALHFALVASGRLPRPGLPVLLVIYAPSLLFTVVTNVHMVEGFSFRGGYWAADLSRDIWFSLFTAYNVVWIIAGVVVLEIERAKAASPTVRRKLRILSATMALPFALAFFTDILAVALRAEVPSLGILWIAIWAFGIRYALARYGLLTSFPRHAAREVLDAVDEAFLFLDEEGKIAWANANAARIAGLDRPEGLRGRELFSFLEMADGERGSVERALRGEASGGSWRIRVGSGQNPAELRVRALHLKDPPLVGAIALVRDLSETELRIKAEEALEEAGLLLGQFLDNSMDGIVITDREGRVQVWNGALERITGLSASSVAGKAFGPVIKSLRPPDSRPLLGTKEPGDSIAAALGGTPVEWTKRVTDFGILDAKGARRTLQAAPFLIPLKSGSVLAAVVRDVSDQNAAIEAAFEKVRRLDHAQKLEAIGTLTGGLAHDFNNIITGVVGTVSLLKLGIEEGDYRSAADLSEGLDIIEHSAGKAVQVVRQLLSLARKRPIEARPTSLSQAVRHAADLTRSSRDPSVALVLDLPEADAVTVADPGQLGQLILNLLINAEHSMTIMRRTGELRGGRILASIRPFEASESFVADYPPAKSGAYWLLSVSDEGVGIPRDVLPRIFEPFFTTKSDGKSTGLGLSMVYTIARQHGGFVDALSDPGKGSELRVWLPASTESAQAEEPRRGAATRGNGRVLIADDEEMPREAASAMLRALGYEPVAVAGGEAAVAAFSENKSGFAAIILDQSMPGMTGDQALRRILELEPRARVIITSGFAVDDVINSSLEHGARGFLPKPFDVKGLAEALARAVGETT